MDKGMQIGCVVYTETNNGIKAEWAASKNGKTIRGTGIGIRRTPVNKNRIFEGEFDLNYLDTTGQKSPTLRLIIVYQSDHYTLTWLHQHKITDLGIGIESEHKLIAGYSEIT